MRLWVDAQLPPELCSWLVTEFSVPARHLQEIGFRDADDAAVFAQLRHEGDVVFTKDEDFIDLATRLGPPPQVLWLRVGNCGNAELRVFLKAAMPSGLDALRRGDAVVELRRARPA